MGVSIAIDDKQFKRMIFRLIRLNEQQIATATRQALNKTLTKMRGITQQRIGLIYNLKKKESKKDLFLKRAFGNDIDQMQAVLQIKGRPIPLIRFLNKGQQTTRSTKGKKIADRPALKIQVHRGKTLKRKDVFLIRGHGGQNVVVRRQKAKKARPLGGRESVPGLATIIRRRGDSGTILRLAGIRLGNEFSRALNIYQFPLVRPPITKFTVTITTFAWVLAAVY